MASNTAQSPTSRRRCRVCFVKATAGDENTIKYLKGKLAKEVDEEDLATIMEIIEGIERKLAYAVSLTDEEKADCTRVCYNGGLAASIWYVAKP